MTLNKEQLTKLGLKEGATDAEVIAAIEKTMKDAETATAATNSLKTAKEAAENKVKELETAAKNGRQIQLKNESDEDDDDTSMDKGMKKVLDAMKKVGETMDAMNKRIEGLEAAKNSIEADGKTAKAKSTLEKYVDRIGGKNAKPEVIKAWTDKLVADHDGTAAMLEAIPVSRKSPDALNHAASDKDDHDNKNVPVSAIEGMAHVINNMRNSKKVAAV